MTTELLGLSLGWFYYKIGFLTSKLESYTFAGFPVGCKEWPRWLIWRVWDPIMTFIYSDDCACPLSKSPWAASFLTGVRVLVWWPCFPSPSWLCLLVNAISEEVPYESDYYMATCFYCINESSAGAYLWSVPPSFKLARLCLFCSTGCLGICRVW